MIGEKMRGKVQKGKIIIYMLLTIGMMMHFFVPICAADIDEFMRDGIYVKFTVERAGAFSDKEIVVNIYIENRNDFAVNNVGIKGYLPEGFLLKEGELLDMGAMTLLAKESRKFRTVLIADLEQKESVIPPEKESDTLNKSSESKDSEKSENSSYNTKEPEGGQIDSGTIGLPKESSDNTISTDEKGSSESGESEDENYKKTISTIIFALVVMSLAFVAGCAICQKKERPEEIYSPFIIICFFGAAFLWSSIKIQGRSIDSFSEVESGSDAVEEEHSEFSSIENGESEVKTTSHLDTTELCPEVSEEESVFWESTEETEPYSYSDENSSQEIENSVLDSCDSISEETDSDSEVETSGICGTNNIIGLCAIMETVDTPNLVCFILYYGEQTVELPEDFIKSLFEDKDGDGICNYLEVHFEL